MRRRPRRADDGRFTDRDAKLWRRLLKHIRYSVRTPKADTSQLHRAADACGKAVPPSGFAVRGSPFLAMVMAGRAFGRVGMPDREAKAAELGALADVCEAALNAPQPGATRADLYG